MARLIISDVRNERRYNMFIYEYKALTDAVDTIAENASDIMEFGCGASLIIRLDDPDDRTEVLRYICDRYSAVGLIDPALVRSPFFEYTLDGSYNDYFKMIQKIEEAAVYENHYSGLIGVDASALSTRCSEEHYNHFLKSLNEACSNGHVIVFFPEKINAAEKNFMDKLLRNPYFRALVPPPTFDVNLIDDKGIRLP